MNKHVIAVATFIFVTLLFSPSVVKASGIQYGGCPDQYGNGNACPSQEISLDKTVQIPGSKDYVDNLTINDQKYTSGSTVAFRIVVQNTGHDTLQNITAEDKLPDLVYFVSGPGSYDKKTKKLSFSVDKLDPGQSQEFFVSAKVASSDKLPKDQGVTCVTNEALLHFENKTVVDTTQFCIQKEFTAQSTTKGGLTVFPAPNTKATPKTGPETLALIALLPSGIIGFVLRRKGGK